MKKTIGLRCRMIFPVLWMAVLFLISFSCAKDIPVQPGIENELNGTAYERNAKNLALAVSRTMASSDDFRRILKYEAVKQADGDYDVLLRSIVDKKLSEYSILPKKSASEKSIKDLLAEHILSEAQGLKSTTDVIDDMLIENPDLQISIPVNAEVWDPVSYTPLVVFLPSDFNDETTLSVPAYTPEGTLTEVDARNEPDDAVVVIGLTERLPVLPPPLPDDQEPPSTPQDLKGTATESGIRLSWSMPSGTSISNTTGYDIYRKSTSNTSFEKIGTSFGYYNTAYDDNNVEPARSYAYFVMAFYGSLQSEPSNSIVFTAPSNPKPVLSFDVQQNSNTQAELRWENDYSQSFNYSEIYRYHQGTDTDYKLFRTMSPSSCYCFDNDLEPGDKFTYYIRHISDLGKSNPKYDFTIVPYRDNSLTSPVYIHAIYFDDWDIESWLAGKPEFYVSIGNVNIATGKSYVIQEKIEFRFDTRFNFQMFPDTRIFDWKLGPWYDMITFNVVEFDRFGKSEIQFSAGFNLKNLEKTFLEPFKLGESTSVEFNTNTDNCGCAYLSYYDYPHVWLEFPGYGTKLLISDKKLSETPPIPVKK